MINVIRITNEIDRMIKVANAFSEPILMEASCYHLFIEVCFKNQEDNFKIDLFNYKNIHILNLYIFETILFF